MDPLRAVGFRLPQHVFDMKGLALRKKASQRLIVRFAYLVKAYALWMLRVVSPIRTAYRMPPVTYYMFWYHPNVASRSVWSYWATRLPRRIEHTEAIASIRAHPLYDVGSDEDSAYFRYPDDYAVSPEIFEHLKKIKWLDRYFELEFNHRNLVVLWNKVDQRKELSPADRADVTVLLIALHSEVCKINSDERGYAKGPSNAFMHFFLAFAEHNRTVLGGRQIFSINNFCSESKVFFGHLECRFRAELVKRNYHFRVLQFINRIPESIYDFK